MLREGCPFTDQTEEVLDRFGQSGPQTRLHAPRQGPGVEAKRRGPLGRVRHDLRYYRRILPGHALRGEADTGVGLGGRGQGCKEAPIAREPTKRPRRAPRVADREEESVATVAHD